MQISKRGGVNEMKSCSVFLSCCAAPAVNLSHTLRRTSGNEMLPNGNELASPGEKMKCKQRRGAKEIMWNVKVTGLP